CGGVLLSCLSSGGGERSRHAIGHALTEHGVQHIDSAASEAEDGLVVALALRTLAVVVGTRWRMSQAGEGRQEQCVLEAVVAESAWHVGVDGRAGFPGCRPEPGVGCQVPR